METTSKNPSCRVTFVLAPLTKFSFNPIFHQFPSQSVAFVMPTYFILFFLLCSCRALTVGKYLGVTPFRITHSALQKLWVSHLFSLSCQWIVPRLVFVRCDLCAYFFFQSIKFFFLLFNITSLVLGIFGWLDLDRGASWKFPHWRFSIFLSIVVVLEFRILSWSGGGTF